MTMTEVLIIQYVRGIVDHRGGHTMSTLWVRLCPNITSTQYSNTPVGLTVATKCKVNSGRNISSSRSPLDREPFRIRASLSTKPVSWLEHRHG